MIEQQPVPVRTDIVRGGRATEPLVMFLQRIARALEEITVLALSADGPAEIAPIIVDGISVRIETDPVGGSPFKGQIHIKPTSTGSFKREGAISLETTYNTGRVWALIAGSGAPSEDFRVRDCTAGADRLAVDISGKVSIPGDLDVSGVYRKGGTAGWTGTIDYIKSDGVSIGSISVSGGIITGVL